MNYMSIVACLWLLGGTLFAYGSPLSPIATNEGGEEESVTCHSKKCQRDESPLTVSSPVISVKPIIVDNADNKSVAISRANINDQQISSAQGHGGEAAQLNQNDSKGNSTGTIKPTTETPEPPTTTTTITSTTTATPPPPPPPTTSTVPSTSPTPKTTESTTTKSTTVTSTTPAMPTSTSPIPTKAPPPTKAPTSAPEPDRRFDGPSFIGGIVFALGVTAIGFVAWKFYKARTERNYHTL